MGEESRRIQLWLGLIATYLRSRLKSILPNTPIASKPGFLVLWAWIINDEITKRIDLFKNINHLILCGYIMNLKVTLHHFLSKRATVNFICFVEAWASRNWRPYLLFKQIKENMRSQKRLLKQNSEKGKRVENYLKKMIKIPPRGKQLNIMLG